MGMGVSVRFKNNVKCGPYLKIEDNEGWKVLEGTGSRSETVFNKGSL